MLNHLNLVGDGDEVDAVRSVEREFDVTMDILSTPNWQTVGDLYAALERALPEYLVKQPSTWKRVCWALARESDDDPAQISPATRLLIP